MGTVRLIANARSLSLIESKTEVQFKAAKADGELPTVDFVAYNGGKLKLQRAFWPVVFDLASTRTVVNTSFLYEHDPHTVVGHVAKLDVAVRTVKGSAVVSGVNEKTAEIKASAGNGFPWQVSLGVDSDNMVFIPQGETVRANGRSFDGPIYLAKENTIREVSLTSLAADDNTTTSLSASYNGGLAMFETWVTEQGYEVATLPEKMKATLQATYDKEQKQKEREEQEKKEKEKGNPIPSADEVIKGIRLAATSERNRIDRIQSLAVEYDNPVIEKDGKKLTVASLAISQNWTEDKAEVEFIKAARPKVKSTDGGTDGTSSVRLLQAALMQAGKIDEKTMLRHCDEKTLQAAHTRFRSRIGLQEFLLEAARSMGYNGGSNYKSNAREILRAAFSSLEIPTVLTTNFNTFLMAGYNAVDQTWRLFTKIGRVSDFKTINNLRVNGSLTFQQIAPDGHIPHGALSEQAFTNKANPYGIMLAITYVDQVNDNLGAITDVPRMIGRGGALGLVRGVWTEFMNNSTFFAAGNNNVSSGALGLAGLNSALAVFRKLKDPTGEYVLATPKYLLHPVELEATAQQLYTSANLVVGTTPASGPGDNPHVGKYQPITSPFLSDTSFTGNSAVAYYLLADPQDTPAIEAVFLDGIETPTIESADTDFSTLGIQLRGTFFWGVKKQDPNAGVRSTGV